MRKKKYPPLNPDSTCKIKWICSLLSDGMRVPYICNYLKVSKSYLYELLQTGKANGLFDKIDYLTIRNKGVTAKIYLLKAMNYKNVDIAKQLYISEATYYRLYKKSTFERIPTYIKFRITKTTKQFRIGDFYDVRLVDNEAKLVELRGNFPLLNLANCQVFPLADFMLAKPLLIDAFPMNSMLLENPESNPFIKQKRVKN